jgi:HK97 gp10 family phage protein
MADEALQGTSALVAKLKTLEKLDSGRVMINAVRDGMKPALKYARQAIPVGTRKHKSYLGRTLSPGFAQKSLRIVVTKVSDTRFQALLGVRKEAFYAVRFVELGTSKMAAEPWLRPAFFASQNAQKQALSDSLRKFIESQGK